MHMMRSASVAPSRFAKETALFANQHVRTLPATAFDCKAGKPWLQSKG